jgi:hypothetical protein
MPEIKTLEDAMRWCSDQSAYVNFYMIDEDTPRVIIYHYVGYDLERLGDGVSLLEAVQDALNDRT